MNEPLLLIIDDEESILSVFSLVLRAQGYAVATARDADTGLHEARRNPPDLILCDINMPGTDGKTLLQTLREDPELAHTQFVLMTGNPRAVTPREGMEEGADDFLVKPVTQEALLNCVQARLRRAGIHQRMADRIEREIRSDLRSTLPHEFITPLAGIVGLTSILREDWRSLPADQAEELLSALEKSAWRLERTVRNYLAILDLGESPRTAAAPRITLKASSAATLIETEAKAAAERNGRLHDLALGPLDLPDLAVGSETLCTVVRELMENACAYSPAGAGIGLGFDREGVLTVTDAGRGMTEAEVRRIRAFHQFNRKQYEQQGLGLGLTLVQKLLGLHGGTLSIESEPGRGTSVQVRFPSA